MFRLTVPKVADRPNGHTVEAMLHPVADAGNRIQRQCNGYYAGKLWLWLDMRNGAWVGQRELPCIQDDQACLGALSLL